MTTDPAKFSGDEREALGGHMDDYFGPQPTNADAESAYEHSWRMARDYYLASGPNSWWAKAGLDYKRWLEDCEGERDRARERVKDAEKMYAGIVELLRPFMDGVESFPVPRGIIPRLIERMETAERREQALREALKEISETFVLGKPEGADGSRLREIALAALSGETDASA